MLAKLVLKDGTVYQGGAFGHVESVAGEVVFNTGMVGYPECFTDPSYKGQILNLTYPLIGNYGVPPHQDPLDVIKDKFESAKIHITGLLVSEYSEDYSHWGGHYSLDEWLKYHKIPAIWGIDTRQLTQKLRNQGSILGKIVYHDENAVDFYDPNLDNLVAEVSTTEPKVFGGGDKTVVLLDCGCKFNIIRSLVSRNVKVKVVPWNWDISQEKYDGLFISNGPGDPKLCEKTVQQIKENLNRGITTFGICLGSQLLARAAGAETYKLKFGHRSQNQPCIKVGSKRCYITSQNHGYAVDERTLPPDWEPLFFNANDGTNEGIKHKTKPFMGVQFHPEASPGPVDTGFLFDEFIGML